MPSNKDRQAPISPPVQRIWIVSPLLHWATLPFIVYLRRGFGYSFLRPRTIFFALSCAGIVGFDYARQKAWGEFWALSIFGVGLAILYSIHFFLAVLQHFRSKTEHDFSSGKSWLLSTLNMVNRHAASALETAWPIWVEPAILLTAGFTLWKYWGEQWLSFWLMLTAPLLWFKECLNFWLTLRQKKKHADAIEDSLELMEGEPAENAFSPPLRSVRTTRVTRTRRHELSAEDELRLTRFSKLLEISPPYQLATADYNYRRLAKDLNGMNLPPDEYNAKLAELNDAIAFIRKYLNSADSGDTSAQA